MATPPTMVLSEITLYRSLLCPKVCIAAGQFFVRLKLNDNMKTTLYDGILYCQNEIIIKMQIQAEEEATV